VWIVLRSQRRKLGVILSATKSCGWRLYLKARFFFSTFSTFCIKSKKERKLPFLLILDQVKEMSTVSIAPLGGLHCQRDSYAQTCEAEVARCSKAAAKASKRFPEAQDLFAIVLSDTVLFPEGGGQPNDVGTIDGVQVVDVQRIQGECVHFVKEELAVGKKVKVQVDWGVRFDHMQHHSGQHLLSAIITKELGFKTTSWY